MSSVYMHSLIENALYTGSSELVTTVAQVFCFTSQLVVRRIHVDGVVRCELGTLKGIPVYYAVHVLLYCCVVWTNVICLHVIHRNADNGKECIHKEGRLCMNDLKIHN